MARPKCCSAASRRASRVATMKARAKAKGAPPGGSKKATPKKAAAKKAAAKKAGSKCRNCQHRR